MNSLSSHNNSCTCPFLLILKSASMVEMMAKGPVGVIRAMGSFFMMSERNLA